MEGQAPADPPGSVPISSLMEWNDGDDEGGPLPSNAAAERQKEL